MQHKSLIENAAILSQLGLELDSTSNKDKE
jgi:hypothetical protein